MLALTLLISALAPSTLAAAIDTAPSSYIVKRDQLVSFNFFPGQGCGNDITVGPQPSNSQQNIALPRDPNECRPLSYPTEDESFQIQAAQDVQYTVHGYWCTDCNCNFDVLDPGENTISGPGSTCFNTFTNPGSGYGSVKVSQP